jgi:hypothetical protein
MPAVRDLHRRRCPLPRACCIRLPAVPCDDRNSDMGREPLRQRLRLPVRQEVDQAMALQVDERGAVADALALRPVVDAEDLGRGMSRERRTPDQVDQGGRAEVHANLPRKARTGRATEGKGDGVQEGSEPGGGAGRGSDETGQTLGEDPAGAIESGAEELADAQELTERRAAPGKIGRSALVVTMDARRRLLAGGTERGWSSGAQYDDQHLIHPENL